MREGDCYSPVRANSLLPTDVPNIQFEVVVHKRFNVEALSSAQGRAAYARCGARRIFALLAHVTFVMASLIQIQNTPALA